MKAIVLAVATLAAGPALGQAPRTAEAVLARAPTEATQGVIDGRLWRCLGTGCRGQATGEPTSQPITRECRRVAARLGELAHYRSGKRVLSPAELAACNAGLAKRDPATALAGTR